MIWIAWIGYAIIFAALFSVVKTLDRLNHSVELMDERLEQMSRSLATVAIAASAGSVPARLERGDSPSADWFS